MNKLLNCITKKESSYVPIWFMRQAGRYLPEFRKIRKNNPDFIKLCLNSELAKDITIQPLNRFDIDAAIIFSDILMTPYGLGQNVKFKKGYGPILENVNFEPVSPKAKVVVNSRTGTVVIGGDVRISPAAVAHGSLSVKIQEDTKLLSEGTGTVVGTSATVAGTAATTAQDTEIEVDQQPARAFVFDPGIELQTLVDALNETGTTATDMVAILEALREAGALRAELIII